MIQLIALAAHANPAPLDTVSLDFHEDGENDVPGRLLDEDRDVQIINGEPATRDDWPMAGGMILAADLNYQGFELPQTTILCSSTLIAPDVVLIAAHCLDTTALTFQLDPSGGVTLENTEFYWTRKRNLTDYQLGAAAANLPEDAIRAKDFKMHGGFNLFQMELGLAENDDIALIFLEEPVLDIPLGYLPQGDTDEVRMDIGEDVVAVGWGQQIATQQGAQPPPNSYGIKQMGTSQIAEKSPYEFKVGEEVSDVRKCHGDSGGPSFKEVETDSSETWRVIGVTSHAYDLSDCNLTGGVDTRVSYYLDWIDNQMRSYCEDGTRVWCEIEGIIPPPLPDGTLAWEIPEEEESPKGACGCSTGAGLSGWLVVALGGLVLRRRR